MRVRVLAACMAGGYICMYVYIAPFVVAVAVGVGRYTLLSSTRERVEC